MTTHSSAIAAAAADFGRHSKSGGGWALGLIVAACVQRGTDNGRPSETPRGRGVSGRKISIGAFARQSGTSDAWVRGHLAAWVRAAEEGVVAHPDLLAPADWNDADHLPTGYEWSAYYQPQSGGRPRDSRAEDAAAIIDRRGADAVVAAMTDEQVEAVVEAATRNRPTPAVSGARRGHESRPTPPPPFDHPPAVVPNASAVEAGMNIDSALEQIATRTETIRRLGEAHPAVFAARARQIEAHAEQLSMIATLARGVPSDASELEVSP